MNDKQIESAIDDIVQEDITTSTKRKYLTKLAVALQKVAPDYLEPLVSTTLENDGKPILAWDGPFDWTIISAGSSVFAGESDNAAAPLEPEIQGVIDEITAAGLYIEPINNVWMGIYDA